MSDLFDVREISLPIPGFDKLSKEAAADGHLFLNRMDVDWADGENQFSDPGELMLGVFDGEQLIAVGGLNICPYSDDLEIGRLRHLYVLKLFRKEGVAKTLVTEILAAAAGNFKIVRLRTINPAAIALYEKHGFSRSTHPQASHEVRF